MEPWRAETVDIYGVEYPKAVSGDDQCNSHDIG